MNLLLLATVCLLGFAASSASPISRNHPLIDPAASDHLANKRRLPSNVVYPRNTWKIICTIHCIHQGGRYRRYCVSEQNYYSNYVAERCPCYSC
ncbi:hypothetical protein BOX15_Mlig033545g3 [Macrostomum lignano]|uniref:ShKT domain-containing protein n=1 Tax=Macrostomum lignano TaxID=282301 RepID=A0A267ER24_9PLAT|nr:hypothetical protein BOX15_Mlig033545g2 [Macrostomum lignano]PAA82951.1 hypothetical protein BOX15_Mlig033545g3 [Macrostomum lignano]